MATFNTAQAQFGQSTANPANLAGGLGNAVGSMMANRGPSKKSAEIYKDMMSHEHGLNKDMATHLGGIQMGINRGEQRHEIKKMVLGHNQSQEAAATAHVQGLETATTQAGLQRRLVGQQQRHDVRMQSGAHGNAVNFASHIGALAEGGTAVDFSHGDTKASFTLKKPAAAAPASSAKPTGPKLIGMPTNIAGPKATAGPKPTVTRGAGGRMVSLNPAKAAAPAKKKAAPRQAQPTVTRDPKTGKIASLKKK
jgi:hypothetical protein